MNSLWPTISVPPGATCTATGATSHTQAGWGISNRRYLGSFTPALTFQGRPIVVRFIWSRVTTGAPRWEQAFSADGGATWETNWIMDFEGRNVPSVEAKEIQPETVLGLHREKGDPGLGHPARDSKEVTSRAPGAFNEL